MKTNLCVLAAFLSCFILPGGFAQTPPASHEVLAYSGMFKAVIDHDLNTLNKAIAETSDIDLRDSHGRTALHVAAYTADHKAMRLLVDAGANSNALEHDRYDIVTIAAVANDLPTLRMALQLGASPGNITSRYDGTALIAAAHLGHVEVVQTLIDAGAPLDHVNNLNWTALIEAIVLGDGGSRHTATLRALVDAGANINLADSYGRSPLQLAKRNNFSEMVEILAAVGAK